MPPRVVASMCIILMGVFFVTLLPIVLAVPSYATGLKPGDSAFYSLFGTYAGTTAVTNMAVTNVGGNTVYVKFTNYPADPTSGYDPGVLWLDLASGQSSNPSDNLFFAVLPGLNAGDFIFSNWNVRVASVQTSGCGGQLRSVVSSPTYSRSGQFVRIVWDQATGLMCNYSASNASDASRSLQLIMDNATLWDSGSRAADPYTTAAEISAVIGLPLVLLIMMVFFRKRRARK